MHDESADRVVFLVIQFALEIRIEILDARQRSHRETRFAVEFSFRSYEGGLLQIVFVIDLANDFFEYVLDRQQARDTAVLIHDDGHMIVTGAELSQQCVKAF